MSSEDDSEVFLSAQSKDDYLAEVVKSSAANVDNSNEISCSKLVD